MRQDYPFTIFGGGSDEGRAMLQIVHDVAPKATLAFRTGFISESDFAHGVRQLADDAQLRCDRRRYYLDYRAFFQGWVCSTSSKLCARLG